MALNSIGSYNLGQINLGLSAGLGLLNPLTAQLDLFLTGSFGFGAFMADLQTQFSAAIAAQASISLQLGNPTLAIQMAITSFGQMAAALQAALSFGAPALSVQLSAQLAATAALAGTLQLKLGGIKAMLSGAAAVKLPALQFIADMGASLSAGPIHLLSFSNDTLAATGANIASLFNGGLGPSDPVAPGEAVYGVLLLTKDPTAFAAMSAILRTS